MNKERANASACILDDKYLYVFCGRDEKSSQVDLIERFDVASDYQLIQKWLKIQVQPSGNGQSLKKQLTFYFDMGMVTLSGENTKDKPKVLIFGGKNKNQQQTNEITQVLFNHEKATVTFKEYSSGLTLSSPTSFPSGFIQVF